MQVVLAGQPALKQTLRLPELMQFAQRVAVDYHLGALDLNETCGYIQHRLVTAGAEKDVFTPAACERIHNFSGGTPRLINLLCETVLVYGFADQREMIDVDLVDEMVLERMKDSVVPIVNRDIANESNEAASKELEKDFPWILPKGGEQAAKPKTETAADETQQIIVENIKTEVVDAEEPVAIEKTPIEEKPVVSQQKSEEIEKPVGNKPKASDRGRTNKKEEDAAEKTKASAVKKSTANSYVGVDFSKAGNDGGTRKKLIRYGAIVAVFSLLLIVSAVVFNHYDETASDENKAAVALQEQQEQEQKNKQLKQLQLEAETLKKERDAALVNIEEEKKAKEEAEKQAEAKAALAIKSAEEKRKADEKASVAKAKKIERQAKLAEAKAKAEADRVKAERVKLEAEKKRIMNVRLEEEMRLKEQREARRMEAEVRRLQLDLEQKKLQELQALENSTKQQKVAEGGKTIPKKDTAECSGPTARFKSSCR